MNKEILKRLEEIEKRANKTTPGPWRWIPHKGDPYWRHELQGTSRHVGVWPEDADFIAHTREDVPWLCQVVRELLAQYAAMREAIEEAIEEITYWHEDMLSEEERMHPRGSGWARVYDKLKASVQPDAGRDLLDRLRKLERVAEAARELLKFLPDSINGEDWEWAWDQLYADSQEQVKAVRERAQKALAALEEEGGE